MNELEIHAALRKIITSDQSDVDATQVIIEDLKRHPNEVNRVLRSMPRTEMVALLEILIKHKNR